MTPTFTRLFATGPSTVYKENTRSQVEISLPVSKNQRMEYTDTQQKSLPQKQRDTHKCTNNRYANER